MGISCDVSSTACAKILLHSAKYPSVAVNGILLGRKTDTGLSVLDAVPLFHTNLNLFPMLEVGLEQIDAFAAATNRRVVGYYQANQNPEDRTVSPVGRTIASLIESKAGPGTVYIVLDITKFKSQEGLLIAYSKEGSGWQILKSKVAVSVPPRTVLDHANLGLLHDFDEHLESLDRDWLQNERVAASVDTR
ncbi:chlorophyll antenna size regulatory protein [Hyaloraphidium curvatum]|nr:chlorophyll antenna size regulatory protein [Hyaloraphidium curvatum]